MNKCLECQAETTNPKFCNSSCAAKYNNKNRIVKCPNKDKTKSCKCIKCDIDVEVNIRRNPKTVKCNECKRVPKKIKVCKHCNIEGCGNKFVCLRINLINHILIPYFGFDVNSIGNPNIHMEFYRIKDKIQDVYNSISMLELYKLIKFTGPQFTLFNAFKSIGIEFRNLSEANKKVILNNVRTSSFNSHKYKNGWHDTWEGKQIFYRSSYELEYAQQLDESKISYDVESLRIEYWDSQECKYRIAIPDFYLPDTNEIVEIKSDYWYNSINMKDKFNRYKELGYNFKLILEQIQYLEPI